MSSEQQAVSERDKSDGRQGVTLEVPLAWQLHTHKYGIFSVPSSRAAELQY